MFVRSYKQTLRRLELLSRPAVRCLAEAQGTLLGLWLLGLMMAWRLVSAGIAPLESSVARARGARRCGAVGPGVVPGVWMPRRVRR